MYGLTGLGLRRLRSWARSMTGSPVISAAGMQSPSASADPCIVPCCSARIRTFTRLGF